MLYVNKEHSLKPMQKHLSQLIPPYFIARSAALTATGIVVLICVYRELFSNPFSGTFTLLAALLYPILFLGAYLYLSLIFPMRELKRFPHPAQHPVLILLSILNYACAIFLVSNGSSTAENLPVLAFLLALPAATASGLPLWQAVSIICVSNLFAVSLLLSKLGHLFLLQIISSQVLVYLLFNTMINEFRQKTIANINLAQLHATQCLLESRVQQQTKEAIARDLHDELGHLSTVISHNLNQYCHTHQNTDPLLQNAMVLTRKMSEQVRSLSHTWQAPVFDIKAAIMGLADNIPRPTIEVDLDGFDGTCSAASGEILFRCCQEIITNSMRHSNATKLQILIMKSPTRFSVSVEDNGRGKSGLTLGKGLDGIRSRILQLGGQVDMTLDTEGFRAQMRVPAV